jgi:quercetin dioxygenase-like cupin family protein
MCKTFAMATNTSRRSFLRTAPAASLALFELPAYAQTAPARFQLFTAAELAQDQKTVQAKPGNDNLVTLKETTVVMTTEVAHAAKEFEWHEQRDHIIQILDGTTLYELAGTPKGTHGNNGKAGEFLAPDSDSPTKITLNKGDMLTIPRGTPHRRTTTGSVTFILISSQGMAI